MFEAHKRMVQDFRELLELPVTRARANMAANTACAYLVDLQDSNEEQRRVCLGVVRAGDQAAAGLPNGAARLREEVRRFVAIIG